MSGEILNIGVVNYNTSDFVENILYSIRLTHNSYKVLVCDNGSRFFDKRNLKNIARRSENIETIFREQSSGGSQGHGEALNLLIEKMESPYGVILDADAVFLKEGWDEILINRLDEEVKAVGAPPVKQAEEKPLDFPSVYATLFSVPTFKDLDIDMRPENPDIGKDTGWEMREKFLDSGYKGETFEAKNTRSYKKGPFRDVLCAEFYFDNNKSPFCSHFGRGATLGAAKYNGLSEVIHSIPIIDGMARRMRGYLEKKKWIDICKNLVDKQGST